jgi:hypothetical protein
LNSITGIPVNNKGITKDEKKNGYSIPEEDFMDKLERELLEYENGKVDIETEDSNFNEDFMDKLERDLMEFQMKNLESKRKSSIPDEKKKKYRSEILKGFKALLFVDTCSFIKIKHQLIYGLIKDFKLILIVPLKIIDELEYRKQKKEADSKKAQESLRFISELREKKLAFIDGDHTDPLSNTEKKVRGDNIIAGCIHWYFQNENLDVHFISDDYGAKLTVNSFTENTYKNTYEFMKKFKK